VGRPDPGLTGFGGLAGFGVFVRDLGVDVSLRDLFFRLKSGVLVVYPMEAQLRLLIDAAAAGEQRVFGVEALASDPLFVHVAGGVVPSIDTVYRDLRRFDEEAIADLDALVAEHGLAPVRAKRGPVLHLDVDPTVEPVFGEHEGAAVGYNPRYHGRPSYHPILARCAETDTVVGPSCGQATPRSAMPTHPRTAWTLAVAAPGPAAAPSELRTRCPNGAGERGGKGGVCL